MAKTIKDLPVGAKVKFGRYRLEMSGRTEEIKWRITAKNHRGYPSNSVTLWSEYIVDNRTFDETERNSQGNNFDNPDYSKSNVDQWLNADNSDGLYGGWFKKTHYLDTVKERDAKTPGFLTAFSYDEKQCLLYTTIDYNCSLTGAITMYRRVFLPSSYEVGIYEDLYRPGKIIKPGYQWEINLTDRERWSDFTSLYKDIRGTGELFRNYVLTRDGDFDGFMGNYHCCAYGYERDNPTKLYTYPVILANIYACMPVTNIKDTTKVSNTTDSEGYYTVIFNTPPTKPSYISSNTTNILGGNTATISWGTSSDPDGDAVKYILQRKVNGTSGWTTITSNLKTTSYTDSITFGWKTVQYRVAAYDNEIPNDNNSYTLSSVYSITNNTPPTISGADKDLGTFSNTGTAIAYTVKDNENNAVTVNISIDGKSLSNTSVTLGQEYKINLTGEAWITLNNGRHSVKIEATDSQGASATRTYTFIKSVTKMTFMNKVPYSSTNMPGRAKIYVNRQIPTNAIFKVYACNNAFDTKPTWEDVTSSVTNNLVFMFTNKTKTASDWGVKIKVVVDRNNTAGECYISEVGGNFA
jgi:hypothetical protein